MTQNLLPTVIRGCGTRMAGGVYAELDVSEQGNSSLEDFLICPLVPLDIEAFGVTPVSLAMVKVGELHHVIDWVGSSGYPSPVDDIEEIRRFGLSARLELLSADQYAKITNGSHIFRGHEYANIDTGFQDIYYKRDMAELGYSWTNCPKGIIHPPGEVCVGHLWQSIVTSRVKKYTLHGMNSYPYDGHRLTRHMPSFDYEAIQGYGVVRPAFSLYARFPIQRLIIVNSDNQEKLRQKINVVSSSPLFEGIVNE